MVKKKVNKFNPVNWNWKKVGAYTGTALVAGFGVGFTVDNNNDNTINKLQSDLTAEQAKAPVVNEVEVIKEVEVDNGNLDLVLEHIYDNDGKVNYLIDDLDDDEVSQIVDRITFINEIKSLAVAELKAEAADELDKIGLNTVFDNAGVNLVNGSSIAVFDEDDIERVRVQDDDDEVVVDDVDFEDNDADILISVKFEQDDIKYIADFNVEIKDGEVDDIDLLEIRER